MSANRITGRSLLGVGILAAASVFLPSPLRSQTYPFQKYTTAEGISHAAVRKVFQDSRGLLWFGTEGGVDSYDGRAFSAYLDFQSDPCPVYEIFEDRSGTLWIGTYGFGLVQIPPGPTRRATKPSGDSSSLRYVTAITEDAQGTVWVGSDDGLFAFRPNGQRVRVDGLRGAGEIYALVVDTGGTIWAGTHRGLFAGKIADPEGMKFTRILRRPTRSLLLRRNGEILAGTSGGGNDQYGFVCRIGGGTPDTILSYARTGILIKAQSLFEDVAGALWVGTGYGLFVVRDGTITHLEAENGLPNENIYDIMQDREGTMWFGTDNGVAKLARPFVINYGLREGLTGYAAISGMLDRKGNLWFGMWNGLNRIDQRGVVTRWDDRNGLPHHTVRSVAEDASGRILAGTPRGLAVIHGNRAVPPGIRGLPDDLDVWSVYSEAGVIWVGGGGRLFRTRGGAVERVLDLGEGIAGGAVQVQCRDRRGCLWVVAGGRDAYRIEADGRIIQVGGTVEGMRLRVHEIHQDREGLLWFCTNRGLLFLEGDSLRLPSSAVLPLIKGPVYTVVESGGSFWFGTEHGVLGWDGRRLNQLTAAEGLASDIITMAFVGNGGTLWFGTRGGISALDPSSVAQLPPVPDVYLDPVLTADGSKPVTGDAPIPYDDRNIVFEFNALSFIAEHEMMFQWMVKGFDREWQEPRRQRRVRYTNLGPGEYVFTVRAANRNGEWSSPAEFPFTIRPPFWRTWWFLSLGILFFGSVLSMAYRYRVNQLLKMERMRRRIAADLHDDIASSLSSVGIYAAVIQQKLQGMPEDVRSLLERIRDLSRESMENIGLIVWSVDPRRDELKEVFRYFQRHAEQLCKAAGVGFESQLPDAETSILLTPEQRRTLFLILKEGLNNALRHSRCSMIRFACSLHGHSLVLELKDNGIGFATVSRDGHGLHNMRSRGESIGAVVEISSSSGEGTSVAVRVRIA